MIPGPFVAALFAATGGVTPIGIGVLFVAYGIALTFFIAPRQMEPSSASGEQAPSGIRRYLRHRQTSLRLGGLAVITCGGALIVHGLLAY